MKKFKFLTRVVSLSLACIMLLGALTACGKKDEDETDAVENTVSDTEGGFSLPDVDYGGQLFTVLCRKDEYERDIHIKALSTESSTVDKKVYERNRFIEDEFGVRFELILDDQVKIENAVSIAALADPNTYDLIANQGRSIFSGVTAGYYYDWNNLEYVDLDAEWWNQSANEHWRTPGGKIFAMIGDMSYLSVGNLGGMYFNKDIIAKANLAKTPYELVDDDEWTLETFNKVVAEVDNSMAGDDSGNIATDSFAYATQRWRGPSSAYMCSGEPLILLGSDGKYTVNAGNERTVNAVEKYFQILFDSGHCYYGSADTDLTPVRNAFKNGRVAFNDDNLKMAVEFKGTELNYGIVPWPKYDDDTEGYYSTIGTGGNTFAVIANTTEDNAERISIILEAMAYYGREMIISYYYDQLLSYQAMKDEDALRMMELIHDNAGVQMIQYTNYGGIVDLPRMILEQTSKYGSSISTAVKVVEGEVLAMLEAWYALDDE